MLALQTFRQQYHLCQRVQATDVMTCRKLRYVAVKVLAARPPRLLLVELKSANSVT